TARIAVASSGARALAARNGRQDRHLVAVIDRGLQAILEADVLAGDVDVDEAAQIAVLGDALAESVVLVEDRIEGLADGRALDLELALATGRGAELGGNLHGDAHRAEILVMAVGRALGREPGFLEFA